jgi:hypothetical protein
MEDPQETPLEPLEPANSLPEPGQVDAGGHETALDEDFRRRPFAEKKESRDGDNGPFHNHTEIRAELISDRISAKQIEVVGQILNQHFNLIAGATEPVPLSARHFKARTAEELALCEEELIFEPEEIEELRSTFEETRVLILAGEPEGGKGSLGLLLGSNMTRTLRWEGLMTCQGLGSGVRVDLETVAEDKAFSRRVVMFEDALAGESSDLNAFLRTIDPLRLTALRERLRKNSAALLLTATSSSLGEPGRRLESLGILRTVAPPAPDLLVRALRHFATRLPRNGAGNEAVASFLDAHETELAKELRTIPRAARFVQEYLVEVAKGNLSIRQAMGRMDDLSHWLTADLAGDLDAQAAALAIVLGSAVPPAAGVPWLAFDDLRRGVTELLRKELRIPEDQPSSPPGLGRDFLYRARAHVAVMPSPLAGLVRFRDERYPQRLWQALLGPAREFATLMIPLLRGLAFGPVPVLREIAASALGRLGQIDPTDLAVPLLRGWTRRASNREELAGCFLQGSVGSGDEAYQDLCLATLRDLAIESGAGVAEAAVRSLSYLGLPDPAVPIRELCDIAQERLPIQFDLLREVAEEVTAKEEEIRRKAEPRQVASILQALHAQGHLLLVAALVPEDRIHLLGAVQYALAGALFSHGGDPGPVLRELLARMKAEPVKLAPLFAYLFLHQRGLIDLLDRHKWRSSAFSTETSRFLLSSRPGERDPEALRELLERIFCTLETFPGFFRFLLEQRFFEVLKSWSREGCEVVRLRPAAGRLLSALRASGNGALRRRMERFLEADPDFVIPGSRLQALAREVLDGRGFDAVPEEPSRPRRLPAWLRQPAGTGE